MDTPEIKLSEAEILENFVLEQKGILKQPVTIEEPPVDLINDDPPEVVQIDNQPEITNFDDYVTSLVELGAWELPEDYKVENLTEEQFQDLIDYQQEIKDQKASGNYLSKFTDPRVIEILRYSEKAGKFADLDKYFTLLKEEEKAEQPITDDESKKAFVIQKYMKKGVPEKRAKLLVETLEVDEELDAEVLNLQKEEKERVKSEKLLMEKTDADKAESVRVVQEKFIDDFYKTLEEKKLPKQKQQTITASFRPVQFTDGTSMQEWQYKLYSIQNNPEHFVELLDLLTDYDIKKGFKLEEKKDEKLESKATKTLLDKIKAHSKGTSMQGRSNQVEQPYVPVNPNQKNVKTR